MLLLATFNDTVILSQLLIGHPEVKDFSDDDGDERRNQKRKRKRALAGVVRRALIKVQHAGCCSRPTRCYRSNPNGMKKPLQCQRMERVCGLVFLIQQRNWKILNWMR